MPPPEAPWVQGLQQLQGPEETLPKQGESQEEEAGDDHQAAYHGEIH